MRLVRLGRAGSTQDEARRLAETGAPAWTCVTAESQSRGRGRLGRHWESRRGGLYLTVVLRPRLKPARLGTVGLRAARAVSRAVESFGPRTRVKPPNDVLAAASGSEDFRKIAGILAESSSRGEKVEWLLLGIGLNVNNPLPARLKSATNLRRVLGKPGGLEAVRRRVLRELKRELGG